MANKKLLFVVILVLFSVQSVHVAHAHHPEPTPNIDAIYQFGDSISDTGNLIRDNPIGEHSAFARLPYGQTFFHRPTGRCSNGRLMVDFIANFFKLPYLDAYLDKEGNFDHGVNFAVAGSTALNTSTLATKQVLSPITNSSLSVQMGWFKSHLHSLCANKHHRSACKDKLAKALFIIETGGNDFNYAFFQQKPMQDVYQMVDEVLHAITNAVKEVIDLGATKVVVPGNFAIGCMPIYLSAFKTNDTSMYDELGCLRGLNEFATFQNDRLQQSIKDLQEQHPKVAIVYADYFHALRGLLQNAASNGFDTKQVFKTCCGIGDNEYNFNMTRMCGGNGVPVCKDPQKLVSWDGVHMTQHAYRVMAKWLLKKIVRGISYHA